MKRLTAKQMQKMPDGTLFVYGGDATGNTMGFPYSDIRVFYGELHQNRLGSWEWFEGNVGRIDASGSDDMVDKVHDMESSGASYPIENEPEFGRHGLFPERPIFFVFEKEDLNAMSLIIARARIAAEGGAS